MLVFGKKFRKVTDRKVENVLNMFSNRLTGSQNGWHLLGGMGNWAQFLVLRCLMMGESWIRSHLAITLHSVTGDFGGFEESFLLPVRRIYGVSVLDVEQKKVYSAV